MTDRRVRFKEGFYDNFYGKFEKGDVYDVPDDIVLPTRDIEYIKGAPKDVDPELKGEPLQQGEVVKDKDAEAAAQRQIAVNAQKQQAKRAPRKAR